MSTNKIFQQFLLFNSLLEIDENIRFVFFQDRMIRDIILILNSILNNIEIFQFCMQWYNYFIKKKKTLIIIIPEVSSKVMYNLKKYF